MSTPFALHNPSGDLIRGDIHLLEKENATPAPVVVICHGFKGFKDWGFFPYLAQRLAEAEFGAVRFNFSHNGVGEDLQNFTELDKFAVNTIGKEMEDLESVLDALRVGRLPGSDRMDASRIALLGHSRGVATAILVGSGYPGVRTLIAWAGISSVDRYPAPVKEGWRNVGKLPIINARTGQEMPLAVSVLEDLEINREKYDILKAVAGLEIPFLVVHGDEDETVPLSEGSLLHDSTPRGLRGLQLIPGGGHAFGAVHPFAGPTPELKEAVRVTLEWLSTRL